MRHVTVAAIQMACTSNIDENVSKAEKLVTEAASKGAQIILLQELFETLYFCQVENPEFFKLSFGLENDTAVNHFAGLAKKLGVVLPISFFEKKNQAHYNSVAIIDADGSFLGLYRKIHIPDAPGYEEKFYFNPGDKGFRIWKTKYATIGVGICWDQWFPETARCMVLMGAEILFFPTAIGSDLANPSYDSKQHWQTCMRGHAASNMVPIVVSNRVGKETIDKSYIIFYGSSFITDQQGQIIQEADRTSEMVLTQKFDLDEFEENRRRWSLFRDRRPEMYGLIMSNDGVSRLKP